MKKNIHKRMASNVDAVEVEGSWLSQLFYKIWHKIVDHGVKNCEPVISPFLTFKCRKCGKSFSLFSNF